MKLLLHACCGPCSLEPVRILAEAGHEITIAYLNSNIAPASEYEHRLKTLLEWAKSQNIPVIEGPYEPTTWQNSVKQTWDGTQENRADRCRACYRIRLEELAHYAHEHGFEGIGTTLTVSPYQYTDIINEELERAAAPYEGLSAVFQDFRGSIHKQPYAAANWACIARIIAVALIPMPKLQLNVPSAKPHEKQPRQKRNERN